MALIDNLQAYYKLDNVNDETANNYDLTNNNSVSFSAAKIGNGANFGTTNTNKSLTVASLLGTTVNSDKTICGWMKMNTELSGDNTYQSFLALGYATEKVDYELTYYRVSGVNSIYAVRNRYLVGSDSVKQDINLGTTNWNHLVLTLSGTSLSLYVNGAYIGSSTVNTGDGTVGSTYTDSFTIGGDAGRQTGSFLSCMADEVGIWSRALSASEVAELYNGGAGLSYPFTTNPLLAFNF